MNTTPCFNFFTSFGWRPLGLLAVLSLVALPAVAVERVAEITAPGAVAPGSTVAVSIRASTDAGANEEIGFLHAEYSVDGGTTWVGFCYEQQLGPKATRETSFVAGPAGTTARVRLRVAFRGGVAGDVDYTGAAIKWQDTWGKWSTPPTRKATIAVRAR